MPKAPDRTPAARGLNPPARLSDGGNRARLLNTCMWDLLDCPSCACWLPDGNLCIADTGSHRLVVVCMESNKVLSTFGKSGTDLRSFRGPKGLAADRHSLYVADCYNNTLKKLRLTDGVLLAAAGGYGHEPGRLRYPHGVALSGDGSTVYVADCSNARVSAFASRDLSHLFSFEMRSGSAPENWLCSMCISASPLSSVMRAGSEPSSNSLS